MVHWSEESQHHMVGPLHFPASIPKGRALTLSTCMLRLPALQGCSRGGQGLQGHSASGILGEER